MTVSRGKCFLALAILLTILDATGLPALGPDGSRPVLQDTPVAGQSAAPGKQPEAQGRSAEPSEQPQNQSLLVTVVDENNVPVPSAQLILSQAEKQTVLKRETDYAGRFKFGDLPPGIYRLEVQKEGFYAVNLSPVRVGETEAVEITLNHQQEFVEVMNVVASPPGIDPEKTAATEKLGSREIINLPYAVPRDIRYALPLLPGVLQGGTGQIHVNGSATRQVFDQLDGFNITDPVSGLFHVRVSIDALRSAEVQGSRASAAYGKGSGGVLSLTTGMGDDRFRFSGTDFIPSVQNQKGIHLSSWTPRVTFAGPLRKGKAWFLEALDGEYHLNIMKDLPAGGDRSPFWRLSNLSKAQVNWGEAHLLTTAFLVNHFRAEDAGLSRFNPLETTLNLGGSAYLFTIKDQSRLSSGLLLETGVGVSRFDNAARPQGTLPYVIRPEGTSGNYFETSDAHAGRLQWIENLIVPPLQWLGRHEFQAGLDIDRITDHQMVERRPFTILREDGTRSRQVSFTDSPPFQRNNMEVSGFGQDRWSLSDRLLLESGIRLDRDEILRRVLLSPRLASTYLVTRDGNTKLSTGIGLYYDATNLDYITRPLAGQRVDLFYAADGQTLVQPPLQTSFQVNERNLKGQRFLNWSVGLDHKFPAAIYARLEFLEKRGSDGWTFVNNPGIANNLSGLFILGSLRRDHYDAAQLNVRRTFKGDHIFFASYTHSVASSNAVLDFSLDNPVFSRQAGGRLPWDSPNRLLTWGILPLLKGFDIAYSLDWRDGYAFSVVNQNQQLVGPPSSHRFPAFFSLDTFLERRIRLLGFLWAVRAGFDNVTGRSNPTFVNNNLDSPLFLTYGGAQSRVLTGQIRLVGRK